MSLPPLNPEVVKERVHNLAKLSTLPHIAVKVMELVENPRTSASSLAELISADQILAARILKLANSAYYGFPRKISTLNLAIVVLGFNALRDLVLSISVINRFVDENGEDFFQAEQFWRHALIVGRGARLFSRYVNYPVAGEVFMAGLLHDIGYPVLLQQFPRHFAETCNFARENNITFRAAENKILNFHHTDLGGWLARGWNLPDKLVSAIRYHHSPEDASLHRDLVNIIHISDRISFSIGEGSGLREKDEDSETEIAGTIAALFPHNNLPLEFFMSKFREESEKIDDFLTILTQKEAVTTV
ncbi:MAG: HDOD domain-containing protein [Calditrichia bacterium]